LSFKASGLFFFQKPSPENTEGLRRHISTNPDGYHRPYGAGFALSYKTQQGFLEKREICDILFVADDINILVSSAKAKRQAAAAAVDDCFWLSYDLP
jgi:hypothetical protein